MSVAKQRFRLPDDYYDEDIRGFINEVCMFCANDEDD